MTDDSTQPPGSGERSWAPETGWPADAPAATWVDVEGVGEDSDEAELDAWLDAQDVDATEPEPEPEPEPEVGTTTPEPAAEAVEGTAEDTAQEPALEEPAAAADEAHGADEAAAAGAGAGLFEPLPEELVATQPAAEDADLEAAAPAVPGERTGRGLLVVLAVLVVLLAGLTAFLAERSVSTRGGGGAEDARHDGLQAARNAARLVFSYDYRHLDKDFAAGKAVTTGTFANQYATTTPKLVEVAKTYKAVVAADVSDAAVVSATSGKVVVLVFVNQQSTSTLSAAPKITQSRVTMTMQHRSGRWLVSDVHAF